MAVCPSDVTVHDLTAMQPHQAPNAARHNGGTLRRDPKTITGLVVHQTAITYGVARYQVDAADGDVDEAQRRRALNVRAHTVAFREGWVVHAHHILSHVYHATVANECSVGLEIEGLYPGLRDIPETAPQEDELTTWGKREADELDERTIVTARVALTSLVERALEAGAPLEYVWAHRQVSRNRRADPGEGIWREVVEVMAPKLGLQLDYDRTWKDGRPIPRAWSGVGRHPY